jgi:hypothetical protein
MNMKWTQQVEDLQFTGAGKPWAESLPVHLSAKGYCHFALIEDLHIMLSVLQKP